MVNTLLKCIVSAKALYNDLLSYCFFFTWECLCICSSLLHEISYLHIVYIVVLAIKLEPLKDYFSINKSNNQVKYHMFYFLIIIIDNRSAVFLKPKQIVHACGGSFLMILWFSLYICTVLYPNRLFIWVLFMTWKLWFCYWSAYIANILFNENMATLYIYCFFNVQWAQLRC
jgi:hypothetical protein